MNGDFENVEKIYDNLFARHPELNSCKDEIHKAYQILVEKYNDGGTLFVAGNGGSAADSEHIVGELCKSFKSKRPIEKKLIDSIKALSSEDGEKLCKNLEGGLPAISLPSMVALNTAISNDIGGEYVYAQALNALASRKDIFLGISTSGNSKNIIYAMTVAKAKGLKVLGLCGNKSCKMDDICDVSIHVPDSETYRIQELHLPVYHALCAMVEAYYWGE